MNRREFIKSSAALVASSSSPRAVHALAPTAAAAHMRQLDYSQVQLLDSPLRQQFDHNHALFLALDNDRLLKPFRQLTGMPAPGDDMGGWYSLSPASPPTRSSAAPFTHTSWHRTRSPSRFSIPPPTR